MRKGNLFETQINKVIEWINKAEGHAHKNYPQRTLDGTFIKR